MTYEEFVKAVEEDVKRSPETYKRYQESGGSKDEAASYFIKGAYRNYKESGDLKHAINSAASCICMEY